MWNPVTAARYLINSALRSGVMHTGLCAVHQERFPLVFFFFFFSAHRVPHSLESNKDTAAKGSVHTTLNVYERGGRDALVRTEIRDWGRFNVALRRRGPHHVKRRDIWYVCVKKFRYNFIRNTLTQHSLLRPGPIDGGGVHGRWEILRLIFEQCKKSLKTINMSLFFLSQFTQITSRDTNACILLFSLLLLPFDLFYWCV